MTSQVRYSGVVGSFMSSLRGKLSALRLKKITGVQPFKMPGMLTSSNILLLAHAYNGKSVKYVLHKPTRQIAVGEVELEHCMIGEKIFGHPDMNKANSEHVVGGFIEIDIIRPDAEKIDWIIFKIDAFSGFYGVKSSEVDGVAAYLKGMFEHCGYISDVIESSTYKANGEKYVALAAKPGAKSNHA